MPSHFLSEPGLQGDSDWRFILERAGNLRAQYDIPLSPDRPGTNPADQKVSMSPVNVFVNVREVNGLTLNAART